MSTCFRTASSRRARRCDRWRPAARVAPPDQRALEATQAALGDAVGQLYAERHFPPAQKARLQAIVANVIAAFRKRVEAASWMSADTRATALAKLNTVYFGVGYPERWQDYSDLVVEADDPVGNLRRVRARDYRRALARLGRPVEPTEWWIPPSRWRRSSSSSRTPTTFPPPCSRPSSTRRVGRRELRRHRGDRRP